MTTLSSFMTTLDNFKGRADTMSAQVNEYTKTAVALYFETNNPSPVNKMLAVSKHLKGINIKQMERYFHATIPCQFDKKSGTFGKKQAKKYEAMKANHVEFTAENDWFTFELPEKDSNYKLNGEKLVEMIQKKIEKASEDGNTPTIEQIKALKQDMVNMLTAELNAMSSTTTETDSEELITPETQAVAA